MLLLGEMLVKPRIAEDEKYRFMFSVEAVNTLVQQGMPFRDAYKKVGEDIEAGNFKGFQPLVHTHAGSIGNLQLNEITALEQSIIARFPFKKVNSAIHGLLE